MKLKLKKKRFAISSAIPAWFAKELTELAGHVDGKPKLRVIWAPDHLAVVNGEQVPIYADSRRKKLTGYKFYSWVHQNPDGSISHGPEFTISVDQAKNWNGHTLLPVYENVYTTPHCFVLEEYVEPVVFAYQWNAMRFMETEQGLVDFLGEKHQDSGYVMVKMLLWHEKEHLPLHARPLDRRLIDWTRKVWKDHLELKYHTRYSKDDLKPPQSVLDQYVKDRFSEWKEQEDRVEASLMDDLKDISRSQISKRLLGTDRLNAAGGLIVGKNPQLYRGHDE